MRFLIVISLAFLLGACSSPEKPSFRKLENVKFNSLSIKKPYSVKLNADAVFYNSNALGAQITSMDFDVFINGKKSTHIKQDVIAHMPPYSDFTLPIVCSIPLGEIFQDLKLTDLLKSKTISYKMLGHLKLGLGGLDVKVPFSYEGEESLGL